MPDTNDERAIARRIAANVRRARVARGWTQQKLAEECELNIRSIQKIEGAERSVLAATLVRIRAALKCSWEELLGR
ncbi:MAG TPA: helix-turn-helix transcriptional regulator [Candidatus Acidoferrum sp.]|nr:helix-turn-helix transcriptional regulator [Candidatus Acidoferrum sp.]